jgi:hypothetical protein
MWILHVPVQAALPQDALKTTVKEPSVAGTNEAVEPDPDQGPWPENTDVTIQFWFAWHFSPVNIFSIPGPQATPESI